MASKKKLLQAAAGAAGGGTTTDIDDVFSTYLYEGNTSTQTITNGINLGSSYGGQSYSFDGSDDLLLRTSDFTSNTDSKTFTFSCWYFSNLDQTGYWYTTSNGASNNGRVIIGRANGNLQVMCYNNSGSLILGVSTSANIPYGSWNHIVVSIDLANSSNRYVYINDSAHTVTYNTYTNDTIGFSNTTHAVSGNSYSSTSSGQTSLAHVFLDYTYRDLSVESNRRLFYSSSGEPATGQASLNPIMYMPLTSESSPNTNSGTGGDFTTQGSPTYNSNFGPDAGSSGEGGLVWIKSRTSADHHYLWDTERGILKQISSSQTMAEAADNDSLTSFNSNGFTLGDDAELNTSNEDYVSWTWRKAEKWFDVLTYTGDGNTSQTINHNLGSTPGMIIVKELDSASYNWQVYHRSLGATKYLRLDTTNGEATTSNRWNDTEPTSTQFTVGSTTRVNKSGSTFVAYLFAHNNSDGEFGPNADQDIIKCGSYTGNGSSTGPTVNLGFEPQWVMIKRADSTSNWFLFDSMRGLVVGGNDSMLRADLSNAENTVAEYINLNPTGFSLATTSTSFNASGGTYIYMAIRRGPLAEPESATDVFDINTYSGNGSDPRVLTSNITPDLLISATRNNAGNTNFVFDRLRGDYHLITSGTNAEDQRTDWQLDYNDAYQIGFPRNDTGENYVDWMWKRAPSYFDVVAYTGDGTGVRTINHNLGVAPEMMWIKARNATMSWIVYHASLGNDYVMRLEQSSAATSGSSLYWNNTDPTSSVWTINSNLNTSGRQYICYLFATVAGVSKVGSFSHTNGGGDTDVDCGFSSGARFVLLKRYDSTGGNWVVLDSVRGIVSGNDPYLLIDSTNAEVTNYDVIDPLSSGFTVADGFLASGNYIFYAIA